MMERKCALIIALRIKGIEPNMKQLEFLEYKKTVYLPTTPLNGILIFGI